MLYLVRFVRKDKAPDEEYFYFQREGAEYHIGLFEHDDSGLYLRIELVEVEE